MAVFITGRILDIFKRHIPVKGELAASQTKLAGNALSTASYSPDDLVSRKGFSIYDEMQQDSQVRSCLNTKKFAVLSKGWQIVPFSEQSEDMRAAEFVRYCLDDMKGSVQDKLFSVLDALAKGFSIMEINYKLITDGPYAGMVGLESVKSKDPAAFGFDMDEYLNIRGLTISESGTQVDLPLEKFIIYTYMPAYEMPYGQSDLRSAYKHYFSKEILTKFWNMPALHHIKPTANGIE